jgi:hypothetical protein
VARLLGIDEPADRLADLVAAGLVRPARTRERRLPRPIAASGPVSDLVADQRR